MISSQYKKRIHSLQKHTLALQLFLIAIGGAIFGISVEARNILRLTKPEFHFMVRGFLELMLISGIVQIVSAGFSCFTACWKLVWPMRIAIGATTMVILSQLAAIISVFYLMSEGHHMVTEDVYVHWYAWECANLGSCHNAFANYVNYYMLAQVLILAVAVFLQGLSVIYLWRFMCTLTEKQLRISRSRDLLHTADDSTMVFGGGGMNDTTIIGGAGRNKLRQQRESVDSIDFIADLLRQRRTSASMSELSNETAPGPKTPITSTMVINTHTQAEIHHFEIDDKMHGQAERNASIRTAEDSISSPRVIASATICTDLGGNRFFCSGGAESGQCQFNGGADDNNNNQDNDAKRQE